MPVVSKSELEASQVAAVPPRRPAAVLRFNLHNGWHTHVPRPIPTYRCITVPITSGFLTIPTSILLIYEPTMDS